jgi:Fe-S oxidoreductase
LETKAKAKAVADYGRICNQCSICSGTCPKARVLEGFLPRRIVYEVLTGNEDRVISRGDPWNCITCAQCQAKCPMGVDFVKIIRDLRRKMLLSGRGGIIAHDNTFGSSLFNILRDRNIRPRRKDFLAKDVETSDSSDVLYFMGCVPYMDAVFRDDVGFEGMGVADNTIRLLNAVDVKPAVREGEKCCGHDQLWRGEYEIFEDLAKQNLDYLTGYDTIVTTCPECYMTLAVEYRERFGEDLKVMHLSEYLLEHKDLLLDKLGENKSLGAVTYHDSCRLGRYMGVYDAPRELLSALGYEVREMRHNRDEALCCGVPQFVTCDDENKEIRRRKLDEALETGAELMVTPCAKCQIHLKCLQRDKGEREEGREYNIGIKDLSTVLMEALNGS